MLQESWTRCVDLSNMSSLLQLPHWPAHQIFWPLPTPSCSLEEGAWFGPPVPPCCSSGLILDGSTLDLLRASRLFSFAVLFSFVSQALICCLHTEERQQLPRVGLATTR